MVWWNGTNFTTDGHEPSTAQEYFGLGQYCWSRSEHRSGAAFFLRPAADAGHEAAIELLGHVLFVQGDFVGAAPWLLKSTGSGRAAYYLGVLHQRGCSEAGIAKSFAAAVARYRRAAQLGEPEAMLVLGDLHSDRLLPVTRSPLEHALEFYLQASRLGHPYGQYLAAEVYRNDYGDLNRAAVQYELCLANASRAGHSLAGLMTQRSQAALRDIGWTLSQQELQRIRDEVHPPHPERPNY
ncbi:SEL1-like repeat protein [Streptacidiphilus sp. PAMC 29251]